MGAGWGWGVLAVQRGMDSWGTHFLCPALGGLEGIVRLSLTWRVCGLAVYEGRTRASLRSDLSLSPGFASYLLCDLGTVRLTSLSPSFLICKMGASTHLPDKMALRLE